ncbi:unnamed protein product [Dicrocoelium dendriticum]|nr:unnamed protein product [Dicrocoelium dendriticum]
MCLCSAHSSFHLTPGVISRYFILVFSLDPFTVSFLLASTASEVEQPRGAQHRMSAAHLDSAATESVRATLVNQPTTPSINGVESLTADPFSARSASLLSVSPDQLPERESDVRLSPNIRHELSYPSHIPEPVLSPTNKTDADQWHLGTTQLLSELEKSVTSRQLADNEISRREEIGVPELSREIHKSCRPLHRTRSRLQHYASEMDRLCCVVLQRLDGAREDCESSKVVDGVDIIIDEATDRLHRILRRLHAFLVANGVSDDGFAKTLMADLRKVITSLSQLPRRALTHTCEPPLDNKENVPPSEIDNRTADLFSHSTTIHEAGLVQRAEHCRRRYHKLTRGIDSFANELSQTADILAATRMNLEQAAGFSVSSERSAQQDGLPGQL